MFVKSPKTSGLIIYDVHKIRSMIYLRISVVNIHLSL